MSSGRGRWPCDAGPRELRPDVICPGTLAAASRRNDAQSKPPDDAVSQNARSETRAVQRPAAWPECRSAAQMVPAMCRSLWSSAR